MLSRLGKTLACATMLASTAGLLAAPSEASASPARPMAWSFGCEYGRACIRLAANTDDPWWNMEQCGDNAVYDHYSYAIANGNGFTVYYKDGTWDYTAPWSQRTLDNTNIVVRAHVYC
ncbi:hypothetical protein [Actinomadura rupiterrae]|uniref:hypothetical protein n=1 Tax=Actinomadura rupiterrae TaxID=559627 RepID=UPI0020A4E418|nr:hypothetical protein [Actinomadura rupiterrae]MCP2342090.1 hypothetical protein [Actinomadura rupiterrae]